MRLEYPSLLITDDNQDFRDTLRSVFEPRGFRTFAAGDGEQALEIVRTESVHLILMDMHMPKLTGLETIRRVKRIDAVLPCILISAQMDNELAQQAMDVEAFAVLSKPVRFAEITETVRQALFAAYDWNPE